MRSSNRAVAVIAAAALLAACNPLDMTAGREQADRATTEFRERYNRAEHAAIAADASPEMPAEQRELLTRILAAVHRKLGKATASTPQGWNVSSRNMVTRVQLVQATTFERGSGTETFVWTVTGGQARLTAYTINSVDLILR